MQKFKNLLNYMFLICVVCGFNTVFIFTAAAIGELNIPEINKVFSYVFMIITVSFGISMAIKFKDYIKLF